MTNFSLGYILFISTALMMLDDVEGATRFSTTDFRALGVSTSLKRSERETSLLVGEVLAGPLGQWWLGVIPRSILEEVEDIPIRRGQACGHGHSACFTSNTEKKEIIFISSASSAELPSLFHHELVHAIRRKVVHTGAKPWIEEGLARLFETRALGKTPHLSLQRIQTQSAIGPLTSSCLHFEKPCTSSDDRDHAYFSSALFLEYILQISGSDDSELVHILLEPEILEALLNRSAQKTNLNLSLEDLFLNFNVAAVLQLPPGNNLDLWSFTPRFSFPSLKPRVENIASEQPLKIQMGGLESHFIRFPIRHRCLCWNTAEGITALHMDEGANFVRPKEVNQRLCSTEPSVEILLINSLDTAYTATTEFRFCEP